MYVYTSLCMYAHIYIYAYLSLSLYIYIYIIHHGYQSHIHIHYTYQSYGGTETWRCVTFAVPHAGMASCGHAVHLVII